MMKKIENESSEIEKEFEYPCPIFDGFEHDLDSGDPAIRGRAFRIFKERFRLVFHFESCEYRIILRGGEVADNEDGCELINNDCSIREYLLLRNTMNLFNLVPTMKVLKAAFFYGRNQSKALNILSNNPDANDEIRAYELVKKAIGFLSKIFDVNYPERLPFHVSTFSPEETFSFMKESLR